MESKKARENSQEELDRFKREVDIVPYALQKGYTIDPEKDSKTFRALRKDDDMVIVSQLSSGQSWYFNQHNPDDKGTIIDFVKTRENVNLGQARQILREYTNTPHFIPAVSHTNGSVKQEQQQTETQRTAIMAEFLKLDKTLSDPSYLHSRGITDETLNSQAFKGKIFNNTVVDKDTGKAYVNTAFPIFDKNGMISVEQKNRDFKAVLEDTPAGSGVWISNNTEGDKTSKLDKLVISESGVDSLSYHQLHHKKGENALYIATVGNLTDQKTELIQEVIDKRKPSQVIAAVDNDNAGVRYRINFLNNLQPAREYQEVAGQKVPVDRGRDIEFKATPNGKFDSKLDLTIRHEDPQQRDHLLKGVKDKVQELNKEEDELTLQVARTTDKETSVRIDFKNTALPLAEELAKSIKEESNRRMGIDQEFVVAHKPQHKDFNDDLRAYQLGQRNSLDQSQVVAKLAQLDEKGAESKTLAEKIDQKNNALESSAPSEKLKDTSYQVKNLQEAATVNNKQIEAIAFQTDHVIEEKIAKKDNHVAAPGKPEVPPKEYFKTLDELEKSFREQGKLEEIKDKVHYYRNFPHLNDEEVDKYVSLKENIQKTQGQERVLGSRREHELD